MQHKYGKKKQHIYQTSPKKKLSIQQRRRKILAMIQDDPGIRQQDMAEKLGCDRGTIGRDIRMMSEEIKYQNTEGWMIQRDRILNEIEQKKALCEDRMQRLSSRPHQGSRWLEEWQKLLDKEAKILGVYSPDRLLIAKDKQFNKDQEDASIDAMMKTLEIDIIDLVPEPKRITDES